MPKQQSQIRKIAITFIRKRWTKAHALSFQPALHDWLDQRSKDFIYQLEVGEGGSYHYQVGPRDVCTG